MPCLSDGVGYIKTFNTFIEITTYDKDSLSNKLYGYTIGVLLSRSCYLDVIEDMRGRTNDISKVTSIISESLSGEELTVTSTLLDILSNISSGVSLSTKEIITMLSGIGASDEVLSYRGYHPIVYTSDITRTYMEALDNVYRLTISKEFVPFIIQVANKKSLILLTKRVLNDVNAYKEVISKMMLSDINITKVLFISTYTADDFNIVDSMLRVILNITVDKTLSTTEIQRILESIGANQRVITGTTY